MKTTPALNRVMKWAWRGHWDPFIQVVYEDHLGALLDEFDVPYLEAPRLLVDTPLSPLFAVIVDDFLTREFDVEVENPINDYLMHRGWKETKTSRRMLEELRFSRCSLFEVTEARSGTGVGLRDLFRPGETPFVFDWNLSNLVSPSDLLFLRPLKLAGRWESAAGVLRLSPTAVDEIKADVEETVAFVRENGADVSDVAEVRNLLDDDARVLDMALFRLPPLASNHWIADQLQNIQDRERLMGVDGERDGDA